MLHANIAALCLIEPELLPIEVYIVGIGIFDLFGSCNLEHNSLIFTHKLDPQYVEICRMCKYELPTSSLSKLIV